ncbi:hypothetical protein D1818_19190 [Aquimarina sp. BL5]|uniref:hypothetical protein n=1 Tax=Aquimarina sp. BL5 TaxID=1714860 RepID=UPI000E518C8D|nr:hypothetical protein [Aquimarina sp. BL5]AXT52844.1 hypothetical protein D1818_19190 [Aquimarina sp. BL5]
MTKKIHKLYLFLFLISLASCKTVKHFVNKEFEPLSVKDQQIKSLEENIKNIDSLEPNIGIRIGKDILQEFLPKEIEQGAKEMNEPNFKVHEFKPSVDLTKQAIIIEADFSASLLEIQTKIKGKLKGYIAISSVKDSIFLLPALKTLKVQDIEFTDSKPKLTNRAIAALIKPAAKHFLDNLNGHFIKKMPSIYTGWGAVTKLNTSELFSNNETTITGPTVDIGRYIKTTSLLVDTKGVSILLELEKRKQTRVSDSVVVATNKSSNTQLQEYYKTYQNTFTELWLKNFQTYGDSTRLSVGITKSTIAGIFNDVLSTASLNVNHPINIPKSASNDKLEIDRLKLDCNSVREKFSFPDFKYGKSCKYSCMKKIKVRIGFIKITKRIEDPFCAAARTACKVARETARVAWQTSRETARIAHQVYNEGRVAACKIAVEASELVNLGRLKTSSEGEGVAQLNINNIAMSNDLSSMHLKTKGNVRLTLKSSLEIQPQDIGHLAVCSVNYDKRITTRLKGDIFTQFSEINFDPVKVGDDIILTGHVAPIGYKAKADMSPLHELLGDPLLATKCPFLYSTLLAGGIAGGAAAVLGLIKDPKLQLLLKGSAVGAYEMEPFTQKLTPIIFRINNGEDRKSNIDWGQNSIEYNY